MCRSSTVKWPNLNERCFYYFKVTALMSIASGLGPTAVKPWSLDRRRFYESFAVCKTLKFPSYVPFPTKKINNFRIRQENNQLSASRRHQCNPTSRFKFPTRIPVKKIESSCIPPANLTLDPLQRYSVHKLALCCHDSWTFLNKTYKFWKILNYS